MKKVLSIFLTLALCLLPMGQAMAQNDATIGPALQLELVFGDTDKPIETITFGKLQDYLNDKLTIPQELWNARSDPLTQEQGEAVANRYRKERDMYKRKIDWPEEIELRSVPIESAERVALFSGDEGTPITQTQGVAVALSVLEGLGGTADASTANEFLQAAGTELRYQQQVNIYRDGEAVEQIVFANGAAVQLTGESSNELCGGEQDALFGYASITDLVYAILDSGACDIVGIYPVSVESDVKNDSEIDQLWQYLINWTDADKGKESFINAQIAPQLSVTDDSVIMQTQQPLNDGATTDRGEETFVIGQGAPPIPLTDDNVIALFRQLLNYGATIEKDETDIEEGMNLSKIMLRLPNGNTIKIMFEFIPSKLP